jgi:hypothetical protein
MNKDSTKGFLHAGPVIRISMTSDLTKQFKMNDSKEFKKKLANEVKLTACCQASIKMKQMINE